MRISNFDCPSCGASLKVKKDQEMISCPYCDSTVMVPKSISSQESSGHTPKTRVVMPHMMMDTGNIRSSCTRTIVSVAVFLLIGLGAFIFYMMKSSDVRKILQDTVSDITGEPNIPVVLEFGGEGMGSGYFQDPEQICVDPERKIYVGESQTGRIQIFDASGCYTGQWNFSESDDIYLYSMALSIDGLLYMVYDSELYIHEAITGELLDSLQHPDGWGFNDVEVCDDGSIVAAWHCNRDDIIRFLPDGNIDFLLEEAISSQSGDSELNTDITVDGFGNIFAYGSFNESIFKFSPDGRFLNRFGSDGDRPGQFTSPSSFCIDPRGRLWVSDFGDLIVFDNNGTYLDTFDPGTTLFDMVIINGYRLYGITNDDTVIQLDLSEAMEDL
ncbi:MAG: hypothetical protein K8S24_04905 [Candidatus Aegiribacteria sp.]|nr:hypothetical protein [Candidatus Aegiribacteria sp.]